MKEQNPHHEVKKRDGGFLIQTQKASYSKIHTKDNNQSIILAYNVTHGKDTSFCLE